MKHRAKCLQCGDGFLSLSKGVRGLTRYCSRKCAAQSRFPRNGLVSQTEQEAIRMLREIKKNGFWVKSTFVKAFRRQGEKELV